VVEKCGCNAVSCNSEVLSCGFVFSQQVKDGLQRRKERIKVSFKGREGAVSLTVHGGGGERKGINKTWLRDGIRTVFS
jgi:hypothetical protein